MSDSTLPHVHGKRWLQAAVEIFSAHPIPNAPAHGIAKALTLLLSSAPEAAHIRAWLQEQNRKGAHPWLGGMIPIGGRVALSFPLPCDYWEADLYQLAGLFAAYPRLSTWDVTEKKTRGKHAKTVANHARLLADALEDAARPDYPPLLELFEDSDALRLAEQMPKVFRFVAGDSLPPQSSPLNTAAGRFAFQFPEPNGKHQLPAILRRLADRAEQSVNRQSPVTRHKTGDPNARVFACKLSEFLTRM